MKYLISLVVVFLMASSVSAVGSIVGSELDTYVNVIITLLLSLAGVVLLIFCQYIGIDIIGMTFNVIVFFIDMLSTIISHVTSREENLISAAIIFIIIVIITFWFL